jgi:hypothetical protein
MSEQVKQFTWQELANQLGVTRQAIVNWRNMPGAPADRDLAAWEEYSKSHNLGAKGSRVTVSASQLKEEKTKWEIEILKNKDARDKRTTIERSEVSQLLLHIATQSRTMLYQFLETEAPPKLDGLAAVAMRPILREMADAIADAQADLINQFEET